MNCNPRTPIRPYTNAPHANLPGRAVPALALLCLLLPACEKGRREWEAHRRTPQQWLDVALEAKEPDERRRAVDRLAATRDGTSEWAVKGYDSIVRTDSDSMVRVAALRALRPAAGPETIPTLLKLLRPGEPPKDCLSAPASVRWEAMRLLRDLATRGDATGPHHEEIITMLLHRTDLDADRNVRLAAVETLAFFPDRRALTALVEVLKERDFALQAAAEDSLRELTGHSEAYDADAWNRWITQTSDPFAAGHAPDETGTRENWWSRLWKRK